MNVSQNCVLWIIIVYAIIHLSDFGDLSDNYKYCPFIDDI